VIDQSGGRKKGGEGGKHGMDTRKGKEVKKMKKRLND
jgi:hypothetical protein